jgi:hypothetical protein
MDPKGEHVGYIIFNELGITIDILQRKKEELERLLNDNSYIPTDHSKLISSTKKEKKFSTYLHPLQSFVNPV